MPSSRSRLGQALVETALVIPILLILLVGAIDFGRGFFGWVNLQQVARIGANFASTRPDLTEVGWRDDYEALIEGDAEALNCELEDPVPNPTFTLADGTTPTSNPVVGSFATLTLECDFEPLTPLIGGLLGDPINMDATSTFPVRAGECVNCPTPSPEPPPPPPAQCRTVPTMEDISVAGARLAWESAGFDSANFILASGEETWTVDIAVVDQLDPLSTCVLPEAIFSSEVTVTTVTPEPENPPTCFTVPNLIGMTVGEARTAWDVDFDAAEFTPDVTGNDTLSVTSQTTDPASTPGFSCLEPTATIDVVTGPAWPAPPPAPCRVPNMINLKRNNAEDAWVAAGFEEANFSPSNGNFTVVSQSQVGGNWLECTATVTVSHEP